MQFMPFREEEECRMLWLPSDESPVLEIDGQCVVELTRTEIYFWDHFSMLILHMECPQVVDERQLLEINRRVFSLRARQINSELPEWKYEDKKLSLQNLIGRLLTTKEKETENIFGSIDWFGHSIPSLSLVVDDEQTDEVNVLDWNIDYLYGVPGNDNPMYKISNGTKDMIRMSGTFQVWGNWLLCHHENRSLIVLSRNTPPYQMENMICYYLPIVMLVYYQQLIATDLLQYFLTCSAACKNNKTYKLRRRLIDFRRKYNPPKVSTYALGEAIYQFLRKHSSAEQRLHTLSEEIEAADNFERMVIERKESRQLTLLTWVATSSVPLATVASIFAVPDKYLSHAFFWLSSIGVTALLFIVIFAFKKFSSKQIDG